MKGNSSCKEARGACEKESQVVKKPEKPVKRNLIWEEARETCEKESRLVKKPGSQILILWRSPVIEVLYCGEACE